MNYSSTSIGLLQYLGIKYWSIYAICGCQVALYQWYISPFAVFLAEDVFHNKYSVYFCTKFLCKNMLGVNQMYMWQRPSLSQPTKKQNTPNTKVWLTNRAKHCSSNRSKSIEYGPGRRLMNCYGMHFPTSCRRPKRRKKKGIYWQSWKRKVKS